MSKSEEATPDGDLRVFPRLHTLLERTLLLTGSNSELTKNKKFTIVAVPHRYRVSQG